MAITLRAARVLFLSDAGARKVFSRTLLWVVRLHHHVVFLDQLRDLPGRAARLLAWWPLPTVNRGGILDRPAAAALIDAGLIGLFAVQHSLMARPWFKAWWAAAVPTAFERCTYVHMANVALFAVVLFWQPIAIEIWTAGNGLMRNMIWIAFAGGWLLLFLGAWSFGILELLGIRQMHRWARGERTSPLRLKARLLYRYVRHPMYWGVLLGVWTTPTMTIGHALLATGLTAYVLIAMRFEERDLERQFGESYRHWRAATPH